MSTPRFEVFGERRTFALEMCLLPDPDGDATAPASSVGSWGQWRLWANGLNLTEHDLHLDDGSVVRVDCVAWYLAPLVRWLAESWGPLLHEEKLPSPLPHGQARTARDAYLSMLRTRGDDGDVFGPWQDWGARHSLRRAAEGGIVPDVFLRRAGDDIEISWGDRVQPGGEAADFCLEPGVLHTTAAAAATAIDGALRWFTAQPALAARPWFGAIRQVVEARPLADRTRDYLAWYLDRQPSPGTMVAMFEAVRASLGAAGSLFGDTVERNFIARLSPAAAMFGALSPEMSTEAATQLLAIVASSFQSTRTHPIDHFSTSPPAWRVASAWDDGYRLAQDFLEEMDAPSDAPIDVPVMLGQLEIRCLTVALGRAGPRGVAIAGGDLAPTIVVNSQHPMNRAEAGRRFTMAHELCHLLHDRDRARRVTHSSTPWAPASVEQRANAFAAMILMPPALVRHALGGLPAPLALEGAVAAAKSMRVGIQAAIRHFANIGEITEDDRERLLDELAVGVT